MNSQFSLAQHSTSQVKANAFMRMGALPLAHCNKPVGSYRSLAVGSGKGRAKAASKLLQGADSSMQAGRPGEANYWGPSGRVPHLPLHSLLPYPPILIFSLFVALFILLFSNFATVTFILLFICFIVVCRL